jgi:DEAD/DEAH box helicase domain-containing protein
MKDTVVFDIETKKSFDEVGGRENLHLLGISVIGAYSYNQDKYFAYDEHQIADFGKLLEETEVLIGFNIKGFDLPVLDAELPLIKYNFTSLDLMDDVITGAGFRISLDNLATATIGAKKSADGLQAIRWYKEGKIDEIKKYCLQDVKVTKDLYEYGKKYGNILHYARDKAQNKALPVSWGKPIQKDVGVILREAYADRKSVEISYATGDTAGQGIEMRTVDIYKISRDSFEGFCHLRKAVRIFKIDKVLSAKPVERAYQTAEDVQTALF